VIGPYAVGLVKDATGSADMALYGIAAVCGFSGVLVAWCLPRSLYPRDQQVTIAPPGATWAFWLKFRPERHPRSRPGARNSFGVALDSSFDGRKCPPSILA